MYWYNLIKNKTIIFVMLSNHDDNSQFVWKIEDYDIFSENDDKFIMNNKWITEFYYFKTSIININNIYKNFFDDKLGLFETNLWIINKLYDDYTILIDSVEQYLLYWIDMLNKDFTLYFKFNNTDIILKFIFSYDYNLYLNLLKIFLKFNHISSYYWYFYFKIKFLNIWIIKYSIVFHLDDFSNSFSLLDIFEYFNLKFDNILYLKFLKLYKKNKYIEISVNISNMDCENIYFFEKYNLI